MTRRFYLAFGIFGALSLMAARAPAQVPLRLTEINGGTATPLSWASKHQWAWVTNAEGVRQLTSKIAIAPPAGFGASKTKAASESTVMNLVNGTIAMRIDGMKERFVVLGASGKKVIEVALDASKASGVIDENCKTQLLALTVSPKPNYYVGTSCALQGERLKFALSLPREVTIVKSDMVDSKGKGESYRLYEIGNIKAASGAIGRLGFRYGKEESKATLDSLRDEGTKNKLNVGRIGVALTYNLLTAQTPLLTASDSKPGIKIRIPSYPLIGKLGVGVDFETTLSMAAASPDTKSINYTQTQIFLSYSVVDGAKFNLSPRGYFVIANSTESSTKAALTHSNLGLGLHATYALSDQWITTFEGLMSSFGSKAVKSHMALEFSVIRRPNSDAQGLTYGVGAKLQNYTAETSSGGEAKFSQTLIYGIVLI